MDQHVSIKEIARLLNCSVKTVRRRVAAGTIPAIQPDGPRTLLRFDVDEVMQAVKHAMRNFDEKIKNDPNNDKEQKLSGPEPLWKRERRTRKENSN